MQYRSKVSYHLSSSFSRDTSRQSWTKAPPRKNLSALFRLSVGWLSALFVFEFLKPFCWYDLLLYSCLFYSKLSVLENFRKPVSNLSANSFRKFFFTISSLDRNKKVQHEMASWETVITRHGKTYGLWTRRLWEDSLGEGEACFWASENYTGWVRFESIQKLIASA